MMNCVGCIRLENAEQCVTLDSGRVVCSYCEDYKKECYEREQKARQLLMMPPNVAKAEWEKVGNERLAKVVKRLRGTV